MPFCITTDHFWLYSYIEWKVCGISLFRVSLSLLNIKTGIINRNAYETKAYDVIQFFF